METWEFRILISTFLLTFKSCCCSSSTGNEEPRIYLGVETRIGEMPFIGGLAKTISSPAKITDKSCTAFLIARQWALTAGHCYKRGSADNFLIRAAPEKRGILVIPVRKWNVHPDFNTTRYEPKQADIALLYLEKVNQDLRPVRISNQDDIDAFRTRPFPGAKLTVAGYGLIDRGTKPASLQKTNIYVQNRCKAFKNVDQARAFCDVTGPNGEGPCPGDSGAPVMLETADGILALGVHSSGDSACRTMARPWGNEGINVRISYYFNWIKRTMCAQDGSKLPYTDYVC